jgi:creatinine amidohydrolase
VPYRLRDCHANPAPSSLDPKGPGTYSPTGIWGDATLATREKGRRVVEAMVDGMLREIETLRGTPVAKR